MHEDDPVAAGAAGGFLSPDGVNALEDLEPGGHYDFGTISFSREEIVDFARKFDPQPFHLDEAAGRASMFGGLVASGLHTLSLMHLAAVTQGFVGRAGRAGMGFGEVKLHRPVRPGDVLRIIVEVVSIRPSSRRTDQGYVRLRHLAMNQKGEKVATVVSDGVFHRRGHGPSA